MKLEVGDYCITFDMALTSVMLTPSGIVERWPGAPLSWQNEAFYRVAVLGESVAHTKMWKHLRRSAKRAKTSPAPTPSKEVVDEQ
jgi:hypothetical protein